MKINVSDIRIGDLFSESSVYTFEGQSGNRFAFKHLGSGNTVTLDQKYVENLLVTADQYEKEVVVGKEDKFWTDAQIKQALKKGEIDATVNVGDLRQEGIRTIFENIGNQVFTVCFKKADKPLSKKAYNEKVTEAVENALHKIESARAGKRSMLDAADEAIRQIVANPPLPFEEGEERVLRGYKKQFSSRDGRYNCMDSDINDIRPVNINTLLWVVVDGVKYVVE